MVNGLVTSGMENCVVKSGSEYTNKQLERKQEASSATRCDVRHSAMLVAGYFEEQAFTLLYSLFVSCLANR